MMDKRDNLEKFIREQIESIETTEGDRMWEQFQNKYPISKPNYLPFLGTVLLIVVGWSGYWLFNNYRLVPVENTVQPSQTEIRKQSSFNRNQSVESADIEDVVNMEATSENVISNIQNQDIESQRTILTDVQQQAKNKEFKRKNERSIVFKKQRENTVVNEESEENNKAEHNELLLNEAKKTTFSRREKSGVEIGTIQKEEVVFKNLKESKTKQVIAKEEKDEPILIPFLYRKSSGVSLPITALPMVKGDAMRQQSKGPWFVDFQSLSSFNSIRQQHIGIGKAWYGRHGHGLELMAGLQHSDGYSVSLDSAKVIRNISITEYRKDKDLNRVLDAYVSGLYVFKFQQFQFSLGGKVSYGIFNQYNIQETTRIIHRTNFNVGSGFSTEGQENNDWQALNRWRFHGMLRFSYQWQYWTIGLTASQQANPLIKDQLAASNKLNNPIQLGLNLRYSF